MSKLGEATFAASALEERAAINAQIDFEAHAVHDNIYWLYLISIVNPDCSNSPEASSCVKLKFIINK